MKKTWSNAEKESLELLWKSHQAWLRAGNLSMKKKEFLVFFPIQTMELLEQQLGTAQDFSSLLFSMDF